jgi:hypothetical protein
VDERVAVDLARGREHEAGALKLREAEGLVSPVRADLQRVERLPQVVDRARERGQVVDDVDRLVDLEVLDHVVVAEDEVLVADVLDVPQRARQEVVDTDDPVTLCEQVPAEVGAEKTRSAGDDRRCHFGPC